MSGTKTILMIAFEFTPCQSAGVQRPSKFAQYLQDKNWRPIILTAENSVHKVIDETAPLPVPESDIYRVKAPDAKQVFGFKNKYFEITTSPDRWWLWARNAIKQGKKLIDQYNPDVIWSTHPIVSTHIVGLQIAKYAKKRNPNSKWVADYRDPVKCQYEPEAIAYPFISKFIDDRVIKTADAAVFVTEQSKALYSDKYQAFSEKFHVIENGYDEENFTLAQPFLIELPKDDRFTLLHSGALFPLHARNPEPLFYAISQLKKSGAIDASSFVLKFRGCPDGSPFQALLEKEEISDLVEFLPNVGYLQSLAEMQSADALLAIQGELFNKQIPGKIYEYIRANQPIVALTRSSSATGSLVSNLPFGYVADSANDLAESLKKVLVKDSYPEFDCAIYTRFNKANELHNLLESLM